MCNFKTLKLNIKISLLCVFFISVNLFIISCSQGNSVQSGYFTFGGISCKYAVANLNASNIGTGYNSICTIDIDEYNGFYSIKLIACYHSSAIMTIETSDYTTYRNLRQYIGY